MRNFLYKLKTDPAGYSSSKIRRLKYNINRLFFSAYMHSILKAKKINVGKNCVFYGNAYFFRYPESKMSIGNQCTFDSSKYRNLIGVDKNCTISTLTMHADLCIGDSSGFSGVKIGCSEKISIGNDCLVGANVLITDTDWHPIDPLKRKESAFKSTEFSKPVKIGNNVFIGVDSIILKGTIIGDNSVIGAGSVVSGIIPSNVIAAGNPCKVIRVLTNPK